MKVLKTTKFLLSLSILFLAGCYYVVAEELYPSNGGNTEIMSYAHDIVPLLTNFGCISCHSNVASLDLEGHADVKVYADNGRLLGSIKHASGIRAMPEGRAKMDDCSIQKIEAWIAQGTKDN